jgi:hypothetical protein
MKYLERRNGQRSFKDIKVMGKVAWDDKYEGQIPMLIIDGQKISWLEFGRMVMSFEGWKFKLEMIDDSEPQGNKHDVTYNQS